jgi:hypothetical protein
LSKGRARRIGGEVFAPHAPRLVALMFGMLAVGCAHANTTPKFAEGRSVLCARVTMEGTSPYGMSLAEPLTNPEDAALLADFPPEVRRTARAADLEHLLVALLREREKGGSEPSPRLLSMELELAMRVAAFARQIEAVSFEVGCTASEIKEVLGDLQHRDQRRQFKLAVGSLIVTAVAASAAGAVSLARPDEARTPAIIGIAGGLVTAALGTLAVLRADSQIRLSHDPNLLAPVFTGADPDHLFPTFVFRMLTLPDLGPRGSPRARLLDDWNADFADVGVERAVAERLLYGSGGAYTPALAEARVQHLERLESTLESLARDLELLSRFVVQKLFGPPLSVPASPAP